MSPSERSIRINQIGKRMVDCHQNCEGASNSRNGTPPRCLYLEESEDEGGVVVVGLNPGHASRDEYEHYRTEGMRYEATVEYFKQQQGRIKYYSRTRAMLKRVGLGGSILWTEVAKCELLCGFSSVSFEMQRRCSSLYLQKELKTCKGWPVVATGRSAFLVASLVASETKPSRPSCRRLLDSS
jgi:hypothetical protein